MKPPPSPLSQHLRPPAVLESKHELLERLQDISRPPATGFLWGRLPPRPWIAVVGSRKVSAAARQAARTVAHTLSSTGATIVSGGAAGIDRAAHEGALQAGGPTLVFAATWLAQHYPTSHASLFSRILDEGGGYFTVASQEVNSRTRGGFLHRNEVLAAASDLLILGECKLQGGATNATKHARRFETPRLILPPVLEVDTTRGAEVEHAVHGAALYFRQDNVFELLADGAFHNPAWQRSVEQWRESRETWRRQLRRKQKKGTGSPAQRLLSELWRTPVEAPGRERVRAAEKPEDPVAAAVWDGAVHVNGICSQTGLAAQEVQHKLLLLTLSGEVYEDRQGLLRYRSPTGRPAAERTS